jgi:hypothetical protein
MLPQLSSPKRVMTVRQTDTYQAIFLLTIVRYLELEPSAQSELGKPALSAFDTRHPTLTPFM